MEVASASVFLVGSVLISLGMIVLVSAVVFVNNIIAKFWKPVKIYAYHTVPRQEPEIQDTNKK
jgi:hypothetical protein